MKCREIESLLSAYLDRELNDDQMQTVTDHLQDCAACRRQHQSLQKVDQQLAGLSVPPGLADRIHTACVSESAAGATTTPSRSIANPSRYAWMMVVAIAASIVLVVGLTMQTSPPDPQVDPQTDPVGMFA